MIIDVHLQDVRNRSPDNPELGHVSKEDVVIDIFFIFQSCKHHKQDFIHLFCSNVHAEILMFKII